MAQIGIAALSPYSESVVVARLQYTTENNTHKSLYVATFDPVFNEHAGFGVSVSFDGLTWTKGIMVDVPLGMRTPLGLAHLPPSMDSSRDRTTTNSYVLYFTRRHPYCNADPNGENALTPQRDNCGGFGASYPLMCAPVYSAKVVLEIDEGRQQNVYI